VATGTGRARAGFRAHRRGVRVTAVCEVCGNDHDKAFRVTTAQGETRAFGSFECAIHAFAPTCKH
jgi:hypothetical protein